MPVDMTHLPRLPAEATPAYVALDGAFRDLRAAVRRDGLFNPDQRAANIDELAQRVHQVSVALAVAGAIGAPYQWGALGQVEHLAKDLVGMGASVPSEHLAHNIDSLLKYGGSIDLARDPLTWHRVGNAIDQFADAVLAALAPTSLQEITPEAGVFVWNGKTILDAPLDQWRLLACLVAGFSLREKVPRKQVLAAVYISSADQPKDPDEALRKMIGRANQTLRLGDIDLRVVAKGGYVWLKDLKAKTGRE